MDHYGNRFIIQINFNADFHNICRIIYQIHSQIRVTWARSTHGISNAGQAGMTSQRDSMRQINTSKPSRLLQQQLQLHLTGDRYRERSYIRRWPTCFGQVGSGRGLLPIANMFPSHKNQIYNCSCQLFVLLLVLLLLLQLLLGLFTAHASPLDTPSLPSQLVL